MCVWWFLFSMISNQSKGKTHTLDSVSFAVCFGKLKISKLIRFEANKAIPLIKKTKNVSKSLWDDEQIYAFEWMNVSQKFA